MILGAIQFGFDRHAAEDDIDVVAMLQEIDEMADGDDGMQKELEESWIRTKMTTVIAIAAGALAGVVAGAESIPPTGAGFDRWWTVGAVTAGVIGAVGSEIWLRGTRNETAESEEP